MATNFFPDSAINARELKQIRARYAGMVTMVDTWLGKVLDKLDALGIADETCIVLTSDHGEHLNEHPEEAAFTHNEPMYVQTLRVPLIVVAQGQLPAGTTVTARAQLADVVPTVLTLLGVPFDAEAFDGTSLAALARGTAGPWFDRRPVVSQTQCAWSVMAGSVHAPASMTI